MSPYTLALAFKKPLGESNHFRQTIFQRYFGFLDKALAQGATSFQRKSNVFGGLFLGNSLDYPEVFIDFDVKLSGEHDVDKITKINKSQNYVLNLPWIPWTNIENLSQLFMNSEYVGLKIASY